MSRQSGINYCLMQFITGYGSYRSYLHRTGRGNRCGHAMHYKNQNTSIYESGITAGVDVEHKLSFSSFVCPMIYLERTYVNGVKSHTAAFEVFASTKNKQCTNIYRVSVYWKSLEICFFGSSRPRDNAEGSVRKAPGILKDSDNFNKAGIPGAGVKEPIFSLCF